MLTPYASSSILIWTRNEVTRLFIAGEGGRAWPMKRSCRILDKRQALQWHSLSTRGLGIGVVCLLALTGPGCSVQENQRDASQSQSASAGVQASVRAESSKTELAAEYPSISASAIGQREAELIGRSFEAFEASAVETWDRYRDQEFRQYEMFGVVRSLIDQIDDEAMLVFLKDRGVHLTPEDVFTSANLIAYLQHENLGTPAVYAWLDLTKGNPDFERAVRDWQTLRQERGLEFAPAFVLLSNAKLTTPKDGGIWIDIFETMFATFSQQDGEKKTVMLLCLLGRLPLDLKDIQPPAAKRIDFLGEELEKQDAPKAYRQMVLAALYQANFFAGRFAEAATWAGSLEPPATGLSLAFIAQVLAKDVDASAATLGQIETLAPSDEGTLTWCRSILRQLKETKHNQESTGIWDARP